MLLSDLLTTTISIPDSAIYALLGASVVFLGIAFLIFVVWLVGLIMSKGKTGKEKAKPETKETKKEDVATTSEDMPDEETIAIITASIMAYYQTNNSKCEFVVKRIKRI